MAPSIGLKLPDILGIAFVFCAHYCLENNRNIPKTAYFNSSEA
jgi:hypothetical protein